MRKIKHEYHGENKTPSIVIDLRRKDIKFFKKATPSEKKDIIDFMELAEKCFIEFKRVLISELNNIK